eukprot:9791797-Karenia_brevis.AAC.1
MAFVQAVKNNRRMREQRGEEHEMDTDDEVKYALSRNAEKNDKMKAAAAAKKAEREANLERIMKADKEADEELEVFLTFMDDKKKKKEETAASSDHKGFDFKALMFNPDPRVEDKSEEASDEADGKADEEADEASDNEENDEAEEDSSKEEAEEEAEEETFMLNFIGRNSGKHVLVGMTEQSSIKDVKHIIWANLHAHLPGDKPILEKEFLEEHRLRIRGNNILEDEDKSLREYGVKSGATLTMVLGLGGGGKRGRISSLKFTPAVQQKIASLPGHINTLAGARFDDDDIKAFLGNLSDEKIAEFTELWDHSRINGKYKVERLLLEEVNIKAVDEASQLVEAFCQQFQE